MAAKKSSPVMDFVTDYLKKKRDASFAEIRDAAKSKRLKVYPIVFGRAQALLGIVKSAPRGSGKAAKARAAKAAAPAGEAAAAGAVVKRKPGRPKGSGNKARSAAPAADMSSLDGIIAAVKQSQQDKDRYREVLVKIQELLSSALA